MGRIVPYENAHKEKEESGYPIYMNPIIIPYNRNKYQNDFVDENTISKSSVGFHTQIQDK